MLCARRKFLKVVGATVAFPVILRAQATTSLTQKKEFHMEIKRNGYAEYAAVKAGAVSPSRTQAQAVWN